MSEEKKAGRPKNEVETISYHRRVSFEEKIKLDEYLKEIRNKAIIIEQHAETPLITEYSKKFDTALASGADKVCFLLGVLASYVLKHEETHNRTYLTNYIYRQIKWDIKDFNELMKIYIKINECLKIKYKLDNNIIIQNILEEASNLLLEYDKSKLFGAQEVTTKFFYGHSLGKEFLNFSNSHLKKEA